MFVVDCSEGRVGMHDNPTTNAPGLESRMGEQVSYGLDCLGRVFAEWSWSSLPDQWLQAMVCAMPRAMARAMGCTFVGQASMGSKGVKRGTTRSRRTSIHKVRPG